MNLRKAIFMLEPACIFALEGSINQAWWLYSMRITNVCQDRAAVVLTNNLRLKGLLFKAILPQHGHEGTPWAARQTPCPSPGDALAAI